MASRFLAELDKKVLILDGAMGATVQTLDLDLERDFLGKENCTEVITRTRPDLLQRLHESFLEAGADAVETNTFGANQLVLAEFDWAHETFAINKEAAEVARAACDAYATESEPRFVVGSLGPGTKLVSLGQTTWDELHASYCEQARGLVAGGVDAFLIETCQDLLQIKCALCAITDALRDAGKSPDDAPILVSVTIETTGTMLAGTEIAAAAAALEGYPIASLGLNCATGPERMGEYVAWLSKHWPGRVSVIPNAGLPKLEGGRTVYPLAPQPFARAMLEFVENHAVNIVGGCCGTTPRHIARLCEAIGTRAPTKVTKEPQPPSCTSLFSPVTHRQDTSIFNIGERTNTNGSRKFKRLLSEGNFEGLVSMGREQLREGSHAIDVCVDYVGRDGVQDMADVVARFAQHVPAPLMLDSTQPEVIEAGLKRAGGKCLINSMNLEHGEERLGEFCKLAKRYNASIVAGCIDDDPQEAMAKTADRKIEIAKRIADLAANKHGLALSDILFDPLVLPVTTGVEADRRLALETIEGVRRIAEELPECQTTVGLSNVSFGLKPPARQVLNSAFLHELTEAGLTSAILHVSKILPRNRIDDDKWDAALDLLYDRRRDGFDPLTHFISLFSDDDELAGAEREKLEDLPVEERLRRHIIDGERENLAESLDEALATRPALEIVNDHLLDGMKTVGELFGSGQMQLPFVLQSAEVMKAAVAHLEPHMPKMETTSKGRIVLATVQGDVHDIGKNLVDIILTNNGYEVKNLGIKQPITNILEALTACDADAIGLSGLLVKSVAVMRENLAELARRSVSVPVLLGGAALNRYYCETELRSIYTSGPVYYGRDAFEGLRIMDHLKGQKLGVLDTEIKERLAKRADAEARVAAARATRVARDVSDDPAVAVAEPPNPPTPSTLVAVDAIPEPPFLGAQVVGEIDLDEIYPFINPAALFRGQWGYRKARLSDDQYQALLRDTVLPIFKRLCGECRDKGHLKPQVVYGYYPAASDAEDLVVFDPEDPEREIERFSFPRQSARDRRCIADYFRPVTDAQRDVLALQCVTVGDNASERARELFENDEYTEYLYLHGFSVECAEGLAEYWHQRVRAELNIGSADGPAPKDLFAGRYQGCRYSFGYPACPEMSDQEKLFHLLKPERIGCTLTENWQITPEQSTSALVTHHPQAKYFAVS